MGQINPQNKQSERSANPFPDRHNYVWLSLLPNLPNCHETEKIMEQEGPFHIEQPDRAGTKIQAAVK